MLSYHVAMWTNLDRPYQTLPPLPPQAEIETLGVLRQLVGTSRALTRLEEACRRLPDPTMLTSTVPLLEAQASSEIENIVTTNDELFRAAHLPATAAATPAVKEALRYREALWAGYEALKEWPVTVNTARKICTALRGHEVDVRSQPGTFIGNPATRERLYTPPEGREVILSHLARWEEFINDKDQELDPLVVMALQHYQFEAIHPFTDGNGRTGRVLNLLVLSASGILTQPVFYLSGYVVRHKDEYYARLRAVTERDEWEEWVLFMLRACEVTAEWTYSLINQITDLQAKVANKVRELIPRGDATALTELLFRQPYVRIEEVVQQRLAQRQTASKWMGILSDNHVLRKEKHGKHAVFINDSLLDLLFEYPLAS